MPNVINHPGNDTHLFAAFFGINPKVEAAPA
jgi:hypothetical protein